ncbi:MAG: 3-oxoacyl-[acyl-carrier-protein] reductase [Marmoricola sp.]|nr:3-oxoacyl-[acyl-carrier-protein] reductase [Marmoricola sp.]
MKDKVVLVTGSATGIGAECAYGAAERGARVVVNYSRSADAAMETAERIGALGGDVRVEQCDVADEASVKQMVENIESSWGAVDVLVNNAGYTSFVDFADLDGMTDEIWKRTMDVNLMGTWHCSKAVAPGMRRAGGAIVNISSVGGIRADGSSIAYVVSKAAINTLTVALARALAPNIRVNAVAAGFVQTRWWEKGGSTSTDEVDALAAQMAATMPLQTVGQPEDIADAVLWFAEHARTVTAQTLIVDSGLHLGMKAKAFSDNTQESR